MEDFDRVILVDKPAGITSFGVVARVRRRITEEARAAGWVGKRFRVGHTGTLDPFATGLMIILTGKETKNAGKYSKLDKVYEATIKLGATSTTGDPEGEIIDGSILQAPSLQEIERILEKFTGKITQIPPIYSAIKVGGERAYKLARKGEMPEIPPRQIEIYSLELLDYDYPLLKIRAHVSSGTYIRTLAEDIGKKLGTGAYTTELRRIKVGRFDIKDAKTLTELGINR